MITIGQIDSKYLTIALITIIMIVAVAIWFTSSVKEKIKRREEFSGIGWALINAIVGLGIIGFTSVFIAYYFLGKQVDEIKSKKIPQVCKKTNGRFYENIFYLLFNKNSSNRNYLYDSILSNE